MKTAKELDSLVQQIYWHVEHGEHKKAIRKLRLIEIDALREAAEICDKRITLNDFTIEAQRCRDAILARAKEFDRENA